MNNEQDKKTEEAAVQKQNQDFPNIPASSDTISKEETAEKEIKHTSELHPDGKTDNTEHSSEK